MAVAASVLEAMLEAGCTAEQIVAVVKADEKANAEKTAKKREQNRIRQQNHRSRNAKSRVTERDAQQKENTPTPPKEKPSPPSPPKGGSSPQVEEAFSAFTAMAERAGIPKPRVINAQRKRKMAGLIRTHGLETVLEAIGAIEASDFCRGQNDRGWTADLDFLMQDKSFAGLIEGKYANKGGGRTSANEPQDPDLITLPADHPDVRAVEQMNERSFVPGQTGKITLRRSDIERAQRLMGQGADG